MVLTGPSNVRYQPAVAGSGILEVIHIHLLMVLVSTRLRVVKLGLIVTAQWSLDPLCTCIDRGGVLECHPTTGPMLAGSEKVGIPRGQMSDKKSISR